MTDGEPDPVAGFRRQLRDLFVRVRRPTYRGLETHADRDGRVLRTSTVSDLLNGRVIPRWDTVETFVVACAHHARAHKVQVRPDLFDVDRWHADYRAMENALADQAAQREAIAGRAAPVRRRRLAVPAQLPPDMPTFVGRTEQLADLDRLLAGEDHPRRNGAAPVAVVVCAIDGTAGVGKTALAVHWAHRVADQFPDGQLYVNLRGFDASGEAMDPATAVRGFLDALEVPPHRIPGDLEAQAALYRSLLTGRRMLIVLDNARDTAQIRSLLPGAPGCPVVVTSRSQLTGLIAANGAHPVGLDLLPREQARDLLAHRLGADRVAAEPEATEEIVTRCAGLPLALNLVAAHAAIRPRANLRGLAEQLRDARSRWHTLTGDDPATDVRTVFSWSYRALTPDAARLFRLLGLHPGPDLTVPAAAALADLSLDVAHRLLVRLERSHLATLVAPGRYRCHDLLRLYAAELADREETGPDREAAIRRVRDHYLHTAFAAARLLNPHRPPIVLSPPEPGSRPDTIAHRDQALAWFTADHAVLLAILRQAAARSDPDTWKLAWCLATFFEWQGHWHDLAASQQLGIDAAAQVGDRAGQAVAHRIMATALGRTSRYDDALIHYDRALDRIDPGDHAGLASIHQGRAWILGLQDHHGLALGASEEALEHYRAAGDRSGQARALNAIGWHHAQLDDYPRALTHCQQALAMNRRLGDPYGQAEALDSLGFAHRQLGHLDEAVDSYRLAVGLFHQAGDRFLEADTLTHLGAVHVLAGDPVAARQAWQDALAILDELDHRDADEVRAALGGLDDLSAADR